MTSTPAQTITPASTTAPLSAAESDPVKLGWMVGSPPPADKVVRFSDGSQFRFPQTRWAFANSRQMVATRNVWRGDGPISVLPRAERDDIDAVKFVPTGSEMEMTWAGSLEANYTDAIVVLHKGRIVHERYFGVMKPHQPHIAMSVTKSLFGTVGAMLVAEGKLDPDALVPHYIPELKGSAYGDASVPTSGVTPAPAVSFRARPTTRVRKASTTFSRPWRRKASTAAASFTRRSTPTWSAG